MLFVPIFLFARQDGHQHFPRKTISYSPWFTSPLLSPTPINMHPGHPSIEPAIRVINTYGVYNSSWKLMNNLGAVKKMSCTEKSAL